MFYLDYETYSETDIRTAGGYKYTAVCRVLLMAYAFDDEPVKLWDATENPTPPAEVVAALNDESIELCAHNAQFDRKVTDHALGIKTDITRWSDSMVKALTCSLPGSLEQLGHALGLDADSAKIADGKKLIQKFCKPAPHSHIADRYTKENSPDEWERFKEYAIRDVETMRTIYKMLPDANWKQEKTLWHLDQKINDRGLPIDTALVDSALKLVSETRYHLNAEINLLTEGAIKTANQRDALLFWLNDQGVDIHSLTAPEIKRVLKTELSETNRRILEIREQASKAATSKYKTLDTATMEDGRIRGTLQFYGANRTGRWSGRMFQPQNLPRPSIDNIDAAVMSMLNGTVDLIYDNPMEVAADCVRSTVKAGDDKKLVVSDLSGIEARVLPWLAEDSASLKVFTQGLDVYKTAASGIYSQPYESVNKDQRFIGKVAVLSLGYQGGPRAFIGMGKNYGVDISEDMAQEIVVNWRAANSQITTFWYNLEKACIAAIRTPGRTFGVRKLKVRVVDDFLMMKLPSGRFLMYYKPLLEDATTPWGEEVKKITFMGINQFSRKWERQNTYGGKLVENATQAVARDVLATALPVIENAGYEIIATVHDEVICETPDTPFFKHEKLSELLATPPKWAEGLPLNAEGYEARRYKK